MGRVKRYLLRKISKALWRRIDQARKGPTVNEQPKAAGGES